MGSVPGPKSFHRRILYLTSNRLHGDIGIIMNRPHLHRSRTATFCRLWLRRQCGRDLRTVISRTVIVSTVTVVTV